MNPILIDLFNRVHPDTVRGAMDRFSIRGIYDSHKNHLVNTYFNGDVLRYSIAMAELFNQYVTVDQECRMERIWKGLEGLKRKIKFAKKYRQGMQIEEYSREYNLLAKEYNELSKGYKKLAREVRKVRR